MQLGLTNIDASELERVFRFFDADESGKITMHELLRGLRVRGPPGICTTSLNALL